jgi:periplasmic divalent cation tolerance protein
MTDKIVVLCTCAAEDEAERVARALVEARLAACVHVLPKGRSFYRWKGALEDAAEFQLVIKTSRPRFDAVRAAIERLHSYEVPEIIALAVVDVAPKYFDWLEQNLVKE